MVQPDTEVLDGAAQVAVVFPPPGGRPAQSPGEPHTPSATRALTQRRCHRGSGARYGVVVERANLATTSPGEQQVVADSPAAQ